MAHTRINECMAILRGEAVDVPAERPFDEKRVLPSGPRTAHIAVIGEAPGYDEVVQGQPFVGKSGKRLREWMRAAGVDPTACYFDNTYPFFPPVGKITHVSPDVLTAHAGELRERLVQLTQLRVIVPTGNIALAALLELDGITKHRGSIYPYNNGRVIKCIPIIHPAAVLRGRKGWNRRGYLDWQRIAAEATDPALRLPERTFLTSPTQAQVRAFLRRASKADTMAVDIETKPSEGRIICVGFSIDPNEGVVLTWDVEWQRRAIGALCATRCTKVWWNKLFDLWYLTREGVHLGGEQVDAMTLLHNIMPTDNVSLAYAASILTREPYWKDEHKDTDDKTADENFEQFKVYNAKDACVTRELLPAILADYTPRMLEIHQSHYADLADPMLDVMLRGVRIDHARRAIVQRALIADSQQTRDALATFNGGTPLFTISTQRDRAVWQALSTGRDPFTTVSKTGKPYTHAEIQRSLDTLEAKTVSKEMLKRLLYDRYQIPAHFRRRGSGEETETADIFALRKIRYDYRDDVDVGRLVDLAIKHAKVQKLSTFIADDKFDDDGRMRFALKLLTETRRMASSTSPRGRKVNSQNIPRDKRVRNLIVPEPGQVCVQVDGSAAEARDCFMRTKDPELMQLALLRSTEYDQHRHTGVICGFAPSSEETPENFAAITKSQRQVCKGCSHGGQRAMTGATLAQTILREGLQDEHGDLIVYTEEFCDAIIARYHKRFPAIRQWHHRVRRELRKHRCLWNAWGVAWPVPYDEMNDELFRRGYSYLLQSDIASWLNQRGFKAVYQWLKREKLHSTIMLQEHDGLVLSCPPDEVYDVMTFLRDSLEAPWDCDGETLWVPIEYQIGPCWGAGEELKTLPSRDVAETIAQKYIAEDTHYVYTLHDMS